MRIKYLILTLTVITLASCGHIQQNPKLPLPPELVLPKIQASELICLPDSTIGKMVKRDKLLQARIKTLIGIISVTR